MELQTFKVFLKFQMKKYFEATNFNLNLQNESTIFALAAENSSENFYDSFYCHVHIHAMELAEVSGSLMELLLKEPILLQTITTELIYSGMCLMMNNSMKTLQIEQVQAPIVVRALPNFRTNLREGLCYFQGQLCEKSIDQKYIRSTTWKCKENSCAHETLIVKACLPTSSPICKNCAAPMEEVLNARIYGNLVSAKFYPTKSDDLINQAILVKFHDARMCNVKLELGEQYFVSGVRWKEHVEAWGLEKIAKIYIPQISSFFEKFDRLKSSNSPWGFTNMLSNVIGRESFCPGILRHIRIALLLSLASLRSKKPISILVVSSDAYVTELLMVESLKYWSNTIRPLVDGVFDGHVKNNWQQAGSLVLANNGICYLGDWTAYKEKEKIIITKCIETNSVTLGDGSSVPTNCAVWTYIDFANRKKQDMEKMFMLHKTFGIIWKVTPTPEEEELIVDSILTKPSQNFDISNVEIRSYIEFINTIEVTISAEALELIQKYFVCTRKARGKALPLTSLDPITSLAEAHARLNNRSLVTSDDVIVALELCENCLGPCPHLGRIPENLDDFRNWLEGKLFPLYPINEP